MTNRNRNCIENCLFSRIGSGFIQLVIIVLFTYIFCWWNINLILLDDSYSNGCKKPPEHHVSDPSNFRQGSDAHHADGDSTKNKKLKDTGGGHHHHRRRIDDHSIYKEKVTEIIYPRNYKEHHRRMFISMVTIQNCSSPLDATTKKEDAPIPGHTSMFRLSLTKYHRDSIESQSFSHFLLLCADHLYKEDSQAISAMMSGDKRPPTDGNPEDSRDVKGKHVHQQLMYCGDKLDKKSSIHCSLTYPIEYLQIQPMNHKMSSFISLLIHKSLNKCQLLWYLKK